MGSVQNWETGVVKTNIILLRLRMMTVDMVTCCSQCGRRLFDCMDVETYKIMLDIAVLCNLVISCRFNKTVVKPSSEKEHVCLLSSNLTQNHLCSDE